MERKINSELLKWKIDDNKRPLLLYGVSGCGKTYSILEFGKKEYKNIVYYNCENNLELQYVFSKNNTLEKVIRGLAAISLQNIFINDTLIIFDNVTTKILGYIKKFFAISSNYHIITVTNDKNIFNNKNIEFNLKLMNLVTFDEYLKYIGKEQLIAFIEDSFINNTSMPFHSLAFEIFNDYVVTGGYPDAIINFETNKNIFLLTSYHRKNSIILKNNLLKLENLIDIKRGDEIFDSVVYQLIKENKKFQYGMLKKGGRSKEYENAINHLISNDDLLKCTRIDDIKAPINKSRDDESFKLYYNDCGLLFSKVNVCYDRLLQNEKLLNVLYENNVAVSLKQSSFNLYYYQSVGKSTVDFVIQTRNGKIFPIEIVHSDVSKSKSLSFIMNKYNLKSAIRVGMDNFSIKKGIKYIPFYAMFCLNDNL